MNNVVTAKGMLLPEKTLHLILRRNEADFSIHISPATEFDAGMYFVVISNYNRITGRHLSMELANLNLEFNRIPAGKEFEVMEDLANRVEAIFRDTCEYLGINGVEVQ